MNQHRLGEFEILILAALIQLGDDAYGVSVRREIEERTGRSIAIGAVYTTLGRLESKGFVSSQIGEPTAERGGRAKRYFRITPSGVQALRESRSALQNLWNGLEEILEEP